ncbi:MAG: tRNA uridine-5-carboxymethylaminomethyl(34) synthesis GTPase MnmE [Synergistaceae bacterium]|nr:tRNA uridine-5-carboxymethylaminomethyl(34) synthesis GTPase MnmE [Synergistaceae bacterium]
MNDTIAAISTALGEGAIAIIRVSGPDAFIISGKILTRKDFNISGKLYLTNLLDESGNIIDRVLAARFYAPNTYTGENLAEIHTHGGILIARLCLDLLLKNGARSAEPGEFTRRAFINGRIDLSQAEGVLNIINSRSIEALHAAARTLNGELSRLTHEIHDKILNLQGSIEISLDFPEGEIYEDDILSRLESVICELENLISRCSAGMLLSQGVRVVIAGSPNVGKSSLLNALLGKNRAIVTDIPGTTRDIINENIIINGVPIILTDTAGLRETDNIIESEGIKLAQDAINDSDICLYVIDSSRELYDNEKIFIDSLNNRSIIIFNKSDLNQVTREINSSCKKIFVSAKNLTGIQELKALIYDIACKDSLLSSGLNTSAGQLRTLTNALDSLKESRESIINSMGEDITAGLMNSARLDLLRVLGLDAGDELLDSMFSRFCVGK